MGDDVTGIIIDDVGSVAVETGRMDSLGTDGLESYGSDVIGLSGDVITPRSPY